jgi:excisionase family DNA binding protein
MAGTFYSAEEAAEKLNKTQKELKELVTDGKLREFRDGSNLLFKAEEVDALAEEVDILALEDTIAPQSELLKKNAEEKTEPASGESQEPALESIKSVEPQQPTEAQEHPEELFMADEDIGVAPATGEGLDDLTDADTALTGQGTSVLGQTDKDYPTTDDTMAETALSAGPDASKEASDGDVNLDSFGSGSGLLDLSLQADDTSLGGILDEIYTPEGEGAEAGKEPAAEADIEPMSEIAEEAEQVSPGEIPAAQPRQEVEAMVAPIMEALPDKQSNILGMMLFLPLIAVLYTMIVLSAGMQGVVPTAIKVVQGFFWYIIAFAIMVTAVAGGASFVMTGQRRPKVKKEKPPKAEKAPKPKKEKKVKPPKPVKEKKAKK